MRKKKKKKKKKEKKRRNDRDARRERELEKKKKKKKKSRRRNSEKKREATASLIDTFWTLCFFQTTPQTQQREGEWGARQDGPKIQKTVVQRADALSFWHPNNKNKNINSFLKI
jgi:hypothetical protein